MFSRPTRSRHHGSEQSFAIDVYGVIGRNDFSVARLKAGLCTLSLGIVNLSTEVGKGREFGRVSEAELEWEAGLCRTPHKPELGNPRESPLTNPSFVE
jgi:hypothetical protein